MADRFRIVNIAPNGRPLLVANLNDGSTTTFLRDTLKFTPAETNVIKSASGRRYDGDRVVQESHSNAQASVELYVGDGVMGKDAALTLAESIAAMVADVTSGNVLEFRPDGASQSIYLIPRGTGKAEVQWRWIEWQGTQRIHLAISWTVAPLGYGDQPYIYEDFLRPDRVGTPGTGNPGLDDYLIPTGSATIYADAAGNLVNSTTAQKILIHTARGFKSTTSMVALRFTATTTLASGNARVYFNYQDANNNAYAQYDFGTGLVSIVQTVSGTPTTNIITTGGTAMVAGQSFLRAYRQGDQVFADVLAATSDPNTYPNRTAQGATTALRTNFTFTGAGLTMLNNPGYQGFAVTPPTAGATQISTQMFFAEPNVAGRMTTNAMASGTPGASAGSSIPGSAPALVDVDIALDTSVGNGSNPLNWGMLAWWPTPTLTPGVGGRYALATAKNPFGLWPVAANGTLGGFSSAAVTGSTTGNAGHDATVTNADIWTWTLPIDPSVAEPDDFTGEVRIEIWARLQCSAGLSALYGMVQAAPTAGMGSPRYTNEFGNNVRILPFNASAVGWRIYRLGILTLPVDKVNRIPWDVYVTMQPGNGSSGTFDLDWVAMVPARSRVLLPTARPLDSNFPKFMPTTQTGSTPTNFLRRINSDLTSGISNNAAMGSVAASNGMSGSPITMPAGRAPRLLFIGSSAVPDDPTTYSSPEPNTLVNQTYWTSLRVQPRYYLLRGTS